MRYTRETKVGMFILTAVAIAVFMGMYLGAFRFASDKYVAHTLYFKDTTGLIKKSEIKIAGVPVGWVENITLDELNGMRVRVDLNIDKAYHLYQDAYGIVRQEGLIGPVYLELIPGTPGLSFLDSETSASHIPPAQVSVETLIQSLHEVAIEMKEVARTVKNSIGTATQHNSLGTVITGMNRIVDQIHTDILPAVSETTKVVYKNVWGTTQFFNDVRERFEQVYFTYDGHFEDMFERAAFSCFKNAKGFFDVRIYPRPDYFYLIGFTTSQQGYIKRTVTVQNYLDDCLNQICRADELPEWARYEFIYNQEKKRIKRNAFKVELQFGKAYKNIALRAGLIEGTGGFAIDVFLPYKNRRGLISTFKMYDFRGQNRLCDERPHLKWINRIFLFDSVYITFGFDDFVSKCNKAVFLGAGFRFGDGDLKYFLPNFVGLG